MNPDLTLSQLYVRPWAFFLFLDAGGVEGVFFARTHKCLLRGKTFQANKPTTAELNASEDTHSPCQFQKANLTHVLPFGVLKVPRSGLVKSYRLSQVLNQSHFSLRYWHRSLET